MKKDVGGVQSVSVKWFLADNMKKEGWFKVCEEFTFISRLKNSDYYYNRFFLSEREKKY